MAIASDAKRDENTSGAAGQGLAAGDHTERVFRRYLARKRDFDPPDARALFPRHVAAYARRFRQGPLDRAKPGSASTVGDDEPQVVVVGA
ncbi:hypothetical protein [Tahibacter soli]|uniref:Uncharacterized protein n=1 Tax=Tahibacter soli TaxID=2983605 RepID=A0A9X3YIV4_9GAMM|nr:hypothetical protein [Tahibacter soli]MDC8011663.1 hypothetical protein [Tahibacter soli]